MSAYAAATRGRGVASMARGRGSFMGRGALFGGRGQSSPLAGTPSGSPAQSLSAFTSNESSAALNSSQDQQQKDGGAHVERSGATTLASRVASTAQPETVEQSAPQQQPAPPSAQSEESASPRSLQDLMRPVTTAARPAIKTARIVSLNGPRTRTLGLQSPAQRSIDEQQTAQHSNDEQQMSEPPDASDEWGSPGDAWAEATTGEGQQAPSEWTRRSPATTDKVPAATLRSEAKGQGHPSAATSSTEAAPLAQPSVDVAFSTPSLDGGGEFRRPAGFFGSTGLNNNGSGGAAPLSQDASQSQEFHKFRLDGASRMSRGGGVLARGGGRGGVSKWRGGGFGGATARQQQPQTDADRDDDWRAHRRTSVGENPGLEGNGVGDVRPPHDAKSESAASGYGFTGQTWAGQSSGNTVQGQGEQPQRVSPNSSDSGSGYNASGSEAFDNSGFATSKAVVNEEKRATVAHAPPSGVSDVDSQSVTSATAAEPRQFVSAFTFRPLTAGSQTSVGQPQAESTPIPSGSVVSVASLGVASVTASANDLPSVVPAVPAPTAEPSGHYVVCRSSVRLGNARLSQLSALVSDDRPKSQPQSGHTASAAPPEVIRPPKGPDEPASTDHSVDRQPPERQTASQVEMPAVLEASRPSVAERPPTDFPEMIQLLAHQHSMLTEGVMTAVCLYNETNPDHFALLPQFIELLQAAGLNTPDGPRVFDDFGNIHVPAPPAAQRQETAHRLTAPRHPTAPQPTMAPARPEPDQRQQSAQPTLQAAGLNARQGPTHNIDIDRPPRVAAPLRQMAPAFRPPAPLRPVASARLPPAQRQEPAPMALQAAGLNAPQGPMPNTDNTRTPREAAPLRQMAPAFRAPAPLRPVAAARLVPAQRPQPVQRQATGSPKEVDSFGNEVW